MPRSEASREHNRQYLAAKRAAMTPDERSTYRARHDATYRAAHREQRRAYDKARSQRRKAAKAATP